MHPSNIHVVLTLEQTQPQSMPSTSHQPSILQPSIIHPPYKEFSFSGNPIDELHALHPGQKVQSLQKGIMPPHKQFKYITILLHYYIIILLHYYMILLLYIVLYSYITIYHGHPIDNLLIMTILYTITMATPIYLFNVCGHTIKQFNCCGRPADTEILWPTLHIII